MAKKTDAKTASKPASKKPTKPPVAAKPAAPAKATPGKASTAAADAKSKAPGKKPAAAKSNGKQPAAKTAAKPASVPAASATKSNSTKSAAAPAEAASAGFYFLSEVIDPQVTRSRPAAQQVAVGRFADFADARQHAIDYLVDLIDRCEIRLWQFKRADSLELFEQLVREHDHPPVPSANEEAPPAPS
jgi:hypothetical protein